MTFQSKRFCMLLSIACFVLLLALKLDATISWSFWIVFTPLWIWKFFGCLDCSLNLAFLPIGELGRVQYNKKICIILSLVYQICLLSFELLVCSRVDINNSTEWSMICIPLYAICLIGAIKSVCDGKLGRTFDLELFISLNIFTFIFIALRLDSLIDWTWTVVLMPLWVIMSLLVVMEVYALLSAAISCNSRQLTQKERRFVQTTSILYAFVLFPLLGFFIIVTRELEGNARNMNNVTLSVPLFVSIGTLMLMTFYGEVPEDFWFGLNRPLHEIFLNNCPMLQKYVNINYNVGSTGLTVDPLRTVEGINAVPTSEFIPASNRNADAPPAYEQVVLRKESADSVRKLQSPD